MKDKSTSNKNKLKGKRRKPLLNKVADYLVNKYDQNEQLRQRPINKSFLDLF